MGMKWKQIRMPDVGSLVHRWVYVDENGKEVGDNSCQAIRKKMDREGPIKQKPIMVFKK
jgi:hypothetical protein